MKDAMTARKKTEPVKKNATKNSATKKPAKKAEVLTSEQEDAPANAMTGEQIAGLPRRKTVKTQMPAEGIYIGSGVYPHGGKLNCTGFCFTYWAPYQTRLEDVVRLCKEEGVGNTLQFWQHDEKLLALAKEARKAGIYTTCIYSKATPEVSKRLIPELGKWYLGYDFGERYTFSIYKNWDDRGASLHALVSEYMGRVHQHVSERQKAGWGNILATSGNFSLDYEVAAGTEVP